MENMKNLNLENMENLNLEGADAVVCMVSAMLGSLIELAKDEEIRSRFEQEYIKGCRKISGLSEEEDDPEFNDGCLTFLHELYESIQDEGDDFITVFANERAKMIEDDDSAYSKMLEKFREFTSEVAAIEE